jgi:hypothetical protein
LALRNYEGARIISLPTVASAQDRWALATREQVLANESRQWSFARTAEAQVADADEGLAQPAPSFGVALVPAPACPDGGSVQQIKQWV